VTDNRGRLEGCGQRLRFMYDFGARVAIEFWGEFGGNLAKTAVGLFQDSGAAEQAVRALQPAGLASGDIRVLSEVADIPTRNVFKHRAHGFCSRTGGTIWPPGERRRR
jgi:hypothetical protein